MPVFDDSDDDAPEFASPPPPPDDRLWRHPSELELPSPAPMPPPPPPPPPSPPFGTRGNRLWFLALSSGLVGATAAVGAIALVGGFGGEVVEKHVIERVQARSVASLVVDDDTANGSDGVVGIAKSVSPAVARLEVVTAAGATVVGSAVLYRSDGYLITNGHVVDDAKSIDVVLTDGRRFEGRLIGIDAWTDIAVVKIDGTSFPIVTMGSGSGLEAGQAAVAVGSPLGLDGGPSVTVGVISATGRTVDSSRGISLHDMIQTDAPIAAGSSGGALCDSSGAVVGITTAVSVPDPSDAGASGLGFATPIELARQVANDIVATGSARHVWLGVEGADLESADARLFGVDGGAVLRGVVADGPAADAGLEPSDVITRIDGDEVTSMSSLVTVLREFEPGDEVTVTYWRGGEEHTATVTLGQKDKP